VNDHALRSARTRLRSALQGRMRWEVPAVRDRPRYAAAVEATLQQAPGVQRATANPLTARILVVCDPALTAAAVEALIGAALERPPLAPEAFRAWREARCASPGEATDAHDHGGHDHDHDDVHGQARSLILGGSVLAGIGLKRAFFGAGVLAASPILGGVSIAATLVSGFPFLRGWWRSISGETHPRRRHPLVANVIVPGTSLPDVHELVAHRHSAWEWVASVIVGALLTLSLLRAGPRPWLGAALGEARDGSAHPPAGCARGPGHQHASAGGGAASAPSSSARGRLHRFLVGP
jgi:hypothetical protein